MKSGRFHWRFGVPGFAAVLMFVLTLPLAAQQVPSPQTAAQVPGPASGNTMTRAYVQAVGRMAYLWGWPLVNMYNRYQTIVKLPESGLLGGIAPAAYNRLAMLTDYMSPDMRAVTLPQSGRRLWHRVSSTGQDLYRPASSRLRRPFLALSSHRRPYGRDFATRQAMGHQARLLPVGRSGLEGPTAIRDQCGGALINPVRLGPAPRIPVRHPGGPRGHSAPVESDGLLSPG